MLLSSSDLPDITGRLHDALPLHCVIHIAHSIFFIPVIIYGEMIYIPWLRIRQLDRTGWIGGVFDTLSSVAYSMVVTSGTRHGLSCCMGRSESAPNHMGT